MPQDPHTTQHVYVVTLQAGRGGAPSELSGRLEHVVSGRRHDFDSGPGLLACLVHEEAELCNLQAGSVPVTRS